MLLMKLTQFTINKYKSIQTQQEINIEPDVTVLVGMNESGKTSILEALAKYNYFTDDNAYKFNDVQDYPRSELKKYQKSGEEVEVVRCSFILQDKLLKEIKEDIGPNTLCFTEFAYGKKYDGTGTFSGVSTNLKEFIKYKIEQYDVGQERETLLSLQNLNDLEKIKNEVSSAEAIELIEHLQSIVRLAYNWTNKLDGYVAARWLKPNIPKFWYYDDYYALPSKINIHRLLNQQIDEESLKTSKALFELADIDIDEIINSTDYEAFIAELEATSNEISDQLFNYWTTNNNLEIEFKIDTNSQNEKILDIRVKNKKHRVSLPLDKRSKGFNWFFSFIVWFSKIQGDKNSNYILLLDEPGLNLHASAQADLLNFIEDLSKKYQVIYTTHSPFMIDPNHLERIRTVVDTENGTVIKDSIKEKDSNTLFPLQAALGYDIAQNLFISKNNLLVEGPADLIYLTYLSNILETKERHGLKPGITIVPVGGLDKVTTFISLLRGNKLNVVCLLDSFRDARGKQKVDDLIKQKIIKDKNIRFFHEFTDIEGGKSDIEDMFSKEEYLKMFNHSFNEYPDLSIEDLDPSIPCILQQINRRLGIERFNHFRPAYKLHEIASVTDFFNDDTLDRFEKMFKQINSLFE
jgi:predicted ATP-dependent endonuclease of OLD family